MNTADCITLPEMCRMVGVSYATVYRAMWDGRLQIGERVGSRRFFSLADVTKAKEYFYKTGQLKKLGGK